MTAITIRRATLLILCMATLAGTTLRAQTIRIVMHDGSRHAGTLESESDDTVVIRTDGNVRMAVPRSAIRTLTRVHVKDEGSGGFIGYGITVGLPGGLNGVLQIQPVRLLGIRLSGGVFGFRGGEIDGVLRVGGKGKMDHNLILGVGMMDIIDGGPEENWQATFIHTGYSYHNKGFNVMVTLGWGTGVQETDGGPVNRETPVLIAQIGFVPRNYFGER